MKKVEQKPSKLTFEQVAQILLLKDTRAVKDYVAKKLIPKISVDMENLTIDARRLAKRLGVDDFTEGFVGLKEATEILELTKTINCAYLKKHKIPFSCLSVENTKGRKLLFRPSLLKAWKDNQTFLLEENVDWIEDVQRSHLIKEFSKVFYPLAVMAKIQGRDLDIFMQYLQGKTLGQIAKEKDLSGALMGQCLQKTNRRIARMIQGVLEWNHRIEKLGKPLIHTPQKVFMELERLSSLNEKLLNEQLVLVEKLKNFGLKNLETSDGEKLIDPFLETPLMDLDLTVRLYNCMKYAEIKTFGQILNHTQSDYMKFRNFGKKMLDELNEFVYSKGYKLAK